MALKLDGEREGKPGWGTWHVPESLERQRQKLFRSLASSSKQNRRPGFLDLLFPLDNRSCHLAVLRCWRWGAEGYPKNLCQAVFRCCRSPWSAHSCHSCPRHLLPRMVRKVKADWAQWHCYSLPWNVLVIFEGLFCILTQEKYFRKLTKLLPPTYVGFCSLLLLFILYLLFTQFTTVWNIAEHFSVRQCVVCCQGDEMLLLSSGEA